MMPAYSRRSQLGMLSGPDALRGFNFFNAEETAASDTISTSDSSSKGGIDSRLTNTFMGSRNAELIAFATSLSERRS